MASFPFSSRFLGLAVLAAALALGPARAGDERSAPHWGYDGEAGPEHWVDLSPEFRACGEGRMQSPIDLVGAEPAAMVRIRFDYRLTPVHLTNNGHTIQFGYQPGSAITVMGKTFRLLQFHFHSRSEHLVGGRSFPAEIHFVHQSDDGDIAVVGVLVEEGQENLAAREFWAHLPRSAGDVASIPSTLVNGRDLLPVEGNYYRYMGSLTTPPCSEGVNWFVLKQTVQFSGPQIAALAGLIGANARPVQPRGHRLLLDALVRD